jgi:Uma2 family endonuclease
LGLSLIPRARSGLHAGELLEQVPDLKVHSRMLGFAAHEVGDLPREHVGDRRVQVVVDRDPLSTTLASKAGRPLV